MIFFHIAVSQTKDVMHVVDLWKYLHVVVLMRRLHIPCLASDATLGNILRPSVICSVLPWYQAIYNTL